MAVSGHPVEGPRRKAANKTAAVSREEKGEAMDTVRIVCSVLAIALLGLIVLRRKKSAE